MTVLQSARSRFRKRGDFEETDYADAQNVLIRAKEALLSGEYDLVILMRLILPYITICCSLMMS